jgi:hypothetical protein
LLKLNAEEMKRMRFNLFLEPNMHPPKSVVKWRQTQLLETAILRTILPPLIAPWRTEREWNEQDKASR